MDSFGAYAYTCRILNAYPVVNKRVDNPRKLPVGNAIVFSLKAITFNVRVKSKESVKNSISWAVYLAFNAVERDTLLLFS